MSVSFVLFTGLEIFIAGIIILEIKYKKYLIKFEDRIIRKIRCYIKSRIKSKQVPATEPKPAKKSYSAEIIDINQFFAA